MLDKILKYKHIIQNIIWINLEKVFRLILVIFVGAWVTRYLGPAKFGILTYSLSIISIVFLLAEWGISSVFKREHIKAKAEAKAYYFSTAVSLKILLSIVFFVITNGILIFINLEEQTKILISIASLSILFSVYYILVSYCEINLKSKYHTISVIIAMFLTAGYRILLVKKMLSIYYFAFASVLENFIILTVLITLLSKEKKFNLFKNFKVSIAKRMLKEGFYLVLAGSASVLFIRIDQFMLKEFVSLHDLGIFSTGVNFSEFINILPYSIIISINPSIQKTLIDSKITNEKLQRLYCLVFWVTFLIALISTFIGGFIIDVLYGEPFKDSALILKISIWGLVFFHLDGVYKTQLVNLERTYYLLYRTLLFIVINIGLNLVLIPEYGIKGAAFATLTGHIIANFLLELIIPKYRKDVFLKIRSLSPKLLLKP